MKETELLQDNDAFIISDEGVVLSATRHINASSANITGPYSTRSAEQMTVVSKSE